ncbi:MAG: ATP-binding protein [Pseudomonadota bacterium]
MKFFGRNNELKILKEATELLKSNITIIYGRRRIGKSLLINKAVEKCSYLMFEGLENQSKEKQISNFISQLNFQLSDEQITRVKNWSDAFKLLIPIVKKKKYVIIFDEFQWMANYRSEIVSELKMVWDQYLKDAGDISLILCGSIASFMLDKVFKSNALYGRCDRIIHLDQFSLGEAQQMFNSRTNADVLEACLCVGGVPKYLELLSTHFSNYIALEKLAFSKDSYFVDEYNRIFISHFGSNEDYERIIRVLSNYPYGLIRGKIAEKLKIKAGGTLTKFLDNLESAGFIQSVISIDKNHKSKLKKYYLFDSYLRFYFAFIEENLIKIKSRKENILVNIWNSQKWYSWLGRSFEYLVTYHAHLISKILGFSGIDYSVGPYFDSKIINKKGVQIDLLFDRADRIFTLCEMKYTTKPIGKEIIQEVDQKAEVIENKFKRSVQRVLITNANISEALQKSHYFSRIITSDELFL